MVVNVSHTVPTLQSIQHLFCTSRWAATSSHHGHLWNITHRDFQETNSSLTVVSTCNPFRNSFSTKSWAEIRWPCVKLGEKNICVFYTTGPVAWVALENTCARSSQPQNLQTQPRNIDLSLFCSLPDTPVSAFRTVQSTEGFHWHLCSHRAGVIAWLSNRNLQKEPAEDVQDRVDALNYFLFLEIAPQDRHESTAVTVLYSHKAQVTLRLQGFSSCALLSPELCSTFYKI